MPILLIPKNYQPTTDIILKSFDAKPLNSNQKRQIYHSDFRDKIYEGHVNGLPLFIMFTGYERCISLALICEYDTFLKELDPIQEAYYFGCCFATAQSDAEPGDIIIAKSATSDSQYFKRLCQASIINNPDIEKPEAFNPQLIERLHKSMINKNISPRISNIFSTIPLVPKKFKKKAIELMDDEWWWPFADFWGYKNNFDVGEYEAAFFVASCNLIRLPCAGILYVREKRDNNQIYHEAEEKDILQVHTTMIEVLKDAIFEGQSQETSILKNYHTLMKTENIP